MLFEAPSAVTIGITSGIIIPKVPQLVPVAKEISPETKNTMLASKNTGKSPFTTSPLKYTPRPSPPSLGADFIIVPMLHANIKIVRAGTIDFMPSLTAAIEAFALTSLRKI